MSAARPWLIILDGAQQTRTVEQIAELYAKGQVTDGSYVWRDGMSDWLPISSVPELRAAMPEPATDVAPDPDQDDPQEIDDAVPTAMFSAKGAEPPRPAASQPPRPAASQAPASQAPASQPPGSQGSQGSQAAQGLASQGAGARSQRPGGMVPSGMAPMIPDASTSSGVTALRKVGPARQDLMAAAAAADPTLADPSVSKPQPAPQKPMMQNVGGQLLIPGNIVSGIMNVPTAFFMAQLGHAQRKKRLVRTAVIGGVIALVGGVAAVNFYDTKSKEAVVAEFGKTATCLLGEPLKERETAAQRARNIQLAVLGTPLDRRGKPGEPGWPASCAIAAHKLAESAKNAGGDYAPMATSGEVLAKALQEDPAATVGFKAQLEKLWADAKSANLKFDKAASGVTAAPKPAAPMSDTDLRALPKVLGASFALSAIRPEPFPQSSIRFVVDAPELSDGPHVCTVSPGEERARCKKVPATAAKLSPGLRLWGTHDDGAKPFYFAGEKGQAGVFRPEAGEQVAAAVTLGASARKDGSLVLLARSGSRDAKLIGVPEKGSPVERPLLSGNDVANPPSTTGLFFDWVAYKTSAKASPASHLVLRKLADSPTGDPGPAVDVGPIDEPALGEADADAPQRRGARKPEPGAETDEERQMAACRTPEATMVRLRGTKNDFVTIFQADRWSSPIKAASKGGTFTCNKSEATSVRVTPLIEQEKNWATITHARCNLSGCNVAQVSMKDLLPGLLEAAPIDAKNAVATDIGGQLLVVWNAGYGGGLRMRMAAPDKIKTLDDTVVADARDETNPQRLPTITDMMLVPSNKQALLFLGTPAGVKLLRIDAEGKVTPISTER